MDSLFRDMPFAEAMAEAKAKGLWLIVSATSATSEPARLMEKQTWPNARVIEWLERKALAIMVDVQADAELATALKVRAEPTIIAFKEGEEKDRLVGFLDPVRLLMWFLDLEGTKTVCEQTLRKSSGDLERDMHGRLAFAKAFYNDRHYEEATEHYVWLWNNIERVDPDMSGVRVSFMAGEIAALVGAHPSARERFTAIRDDAAVAADADPLSTKHRLDWVVLNKALGDEERTLAWFDGVKSAADAEDVVRSVGRFLIEMLKQRERWADLGRLYRNPLRELAFQHEALATAPLTEMSSILGGEAAAQVEELMGSQFRQAAAELYASLRAAGRAADAKAVHDEALRLDPSEKMRTALEQSPVRYD